MSDSVPSKMLLYTPETIDPHINLAREEYLLENARQPVMMLWRNRSSVIIGRAQNAYAEIDLDFVQSGSIDVVRRLSGGGAVFHDEGNLNYSFITPAAKPSDGVSLPGGSGGGTAPLDFERFCAPIITVLRRWGVPAELSGRNDITVEGKKISGTAQCMYRGALLHHGTLLFDADIGWMEGALRVDPEKIRAKGIKSVRSRVGNLREYLPDIADACELSRRLADCMISGEGEMPVTVEAAEFTAEQEAEIAALAEKKYSTWEWNFGRSREFSRSCRARFPHGGVSIRYDADGGVITAAVIEGDFFSPSDGALSGGADALAAKLIGCRIEKSALTAALEGCGEYIAGADAESMAAMILGGK